MIKTNNKSLCSGCGICSLVCPSQCIRFHEDEIGARYPDIDAGKCINCGRCEQVCPIQREFDNTRIGISAYAAYAADMDIRYRGASGGMFETLAGWIIQEGGSVFASRFDENLKLKCFEAETLQQVQSLTKSKYLQSDCTSAFPIIRQRINEGKKVLFCATPCLVRALKNYLGKSADNANVYLVDFFCHGVPPQSLFDKCRDYTEKKQGIKILDYQFRTKIPGGSTPHYYTIKYRKNGAEKLKTGLYLKDPFYLGFQKYLTLRDSCYDCPYGKGDHSGDLTIGDFHNIDKYIRGINRFDGVSTAIVNTERGKQLWSMVSGHLHFHEMDLKKLHNDKEVYPGGTVKPARRDEFMDDLRSKDFSCMVDKWFNSKHEWKKELYYSLPSFARKILKKLAGL